MFETTENPPKNHREWAGTSQQMAVARWSVQSAKAGFVTEPDVSRNPAIEFRYSTERCDPVFQKYETENQQADR